MALLRMHPIAALVAAVVASAAVSVREFAPASGERGPVAWIVKSSGRAAPGAAPAASDTVDAATNTTNALATTALALGSLSAQELDELRAGLDLLASRLETRANPFGDDLEDGPPGEAMAAVRRSLLPALTASHHLAARTQSSADGTFAIVLGASCAEAPADATCFPLWQPERDERDELRARASFFAWPITSAAVVRFDDAKRAAEVLEVLRDRSRSPDSRISLALDERSLAGAADPRIDAVREAARRVFAHVGAARSSELDALRPLALKPPPGRRVPWLVLGSGEIMVVPKLGGLSDLPSFRRELDQVMTARGLDHEARWVRRPER